MTIGYPLLLLCCTGLACCTVLAWYGVMILAGVLERRWSVGGGAWCW